MTIRTDEADNADTCKVWGHTELHPTAEWNGWKGGRVWRWMIGYGVEISVHQQDPGPAYGVFYELGFGRHVVNIHDTIHRSTVGGVTVWTVSRAAA